MRDVTAKYPDQTGQKMQFKIIAQSGQPWREIISTLQIFAIRNRATNVVITTFSNLFYFLRKIGVFL
jgi:hypothetical protein